MGQNLSEVRSEALVRRASEEDAGELTRLRVLMFADMGYATASTDERWRKRNIEHFRARLRDVDEFAAFVIDKPKGGLAACAVGWLNAHLVGLRNLSAQSGYIANMCTDVGFRRRGYGRTTLTALLEWMRSTGIGLVHLHASRDGDALYRSMGFTDPDEPALTLRL